MILEQCMPTIPRVDYGYDEPLIKGHRQCEIIARKTMLLPRLTSTDALQPS